MGFCFTIINGIRSTPSSHSRSVNERTSVYGANGRSMKPQGWQLKASSFLPSLFVCVDDCRVRDVSPAWLTYLSNIEDCQDETGRFSHTAISLEAFFSLRQFWASSFPPPFIRWKKLIERPKSIACVIASISVNIRGRFRRNESVVAFSFDWFPTSCFMALIQTEGNLWRSSSDVYPRERNKHRMSIKS